MHDAICQELVRDPPKPCLFPLAFGIKLFVTRNWNTFEGSYVPLKFFLCTPLRHCVTWTQGCTRASVCTSLYVTLAPSERKQTGNASPSTAMQSSPVHAHGACDAAKLAAPEIRPQFRGGPRRRPVTMAVTDQRPKGPSTMTRTVRFEHDEDGNSLPRRKRLAHLAHYTSRHEDAAHKVHAELDALDDARRIAAGVLGRGQ